MERIEWFKLKDGGYKIYVKNDYNVKLENIETPTYIDTIYKIKELTLTRNINKLNIKRMDE